MQCKICTKCKQNLTVDLFAKRKSSKDGCRTECKSCRKILEKLRYENNKDHILAQQKEYSKKKKCDPCHISKLKNYAREHFKNNPIKYILSRCKTRAVNSGLDFNIDESDIVIPEFCPIMQIPIYKGVGSSVDNSPSVDRIDNSKGYVKGNIQIISNLANRMKNSANIEQLRLFANWINNNYP